QRDWSTPVLYLGTRSGRVLDLADASTDDLLAKLTQAVSESAFARQALGQLTEQMQTLMSKFAEIEQIQHRLKQLEEARTRAEYLLNDLGGRGARVPGDQFARVQREWTAGLRPMLPTVIPATDPPDQWLFSEIIKRRDLADGAIDQSALG